VVFASRTYLYKLSTGTHSNPGLTNVAVVLEYYEILIMIVLPLEMHHPRFFPLGHGVSDQLRLIARRKGRLIYFKGHYPARPFIASDVYHWLVGSSSVSHDNVALNDHFVVDYGIRSNSLLSVLSHDKSMRCLLAFLPLSL
jgi:hypothetical protein